MGAAILGMTIAACTSLPEGKLYPIRGEVVSVAAARNEVMLRHEPIAGFMEAMTMPFPVAKYELLEGIEPGDRVEGVLLVEGTRFVLLSLAEIPPAAEEAKPAPPGESS
ncbi:MAG TPA: copper-binding protein [Candidatus Binatia bacterium]